MVPVDISEQLIVRDREILDGTPVFAGTRVPVQKLFDYLEAGDPLDKFLDDFPSVRREQAVTLLGILKQAILAANTSDVSTR
jgi:uncharacterized protein (DUF433 family)